MIVEAKFTTSGMTKGKHYDVIGEVKSINGLTIVLDDGTIAVRHKCAFNIINYETNGKEKFDIMNKKINEIKRTLMERYYVALGKQCTKEYIIYYFYLDYNGDIVKKYEKIHYQSKEGYRKKWKATETKISIQKFLDDVVYDLLNRGYELEVPYE